jgi:RHS repeat-associated protein
MRGKRWGQFLTVHSDISGDGKEVQTQELTPKMTQTTYGYEVFGKSIVNGTSMNVFQYTGRENDGTSLSYYRARYYSPYLQRFVSEDPIGIEGGVNFYAYVRNAPTNWTDPTGLQAQVCCRPAFDGFALGAKHCFIRDDQGRTYSFFASGFFGGGGSMPGMTRYRENHKDDFSYKDPSGCQDCSPKDGMCEQDQRKCFQKNGQAYSGYIYAPPFYTSNTGTAYVASKCCKGGFPPGFTAPGSGIGSLQGSSP